MGLPCRPLRPPLSALIAAFATLLAIPALASADCSLPTGPVNGNLDDGVNPADEIVYQGTLTSSVGLDYLQIPFQVDPGVKGMRIRYCYEKQNPADPAPTLDLGVYGPRTAGQDNWTMDDLRGWSGSAVKIVGIGENGYSDPSTYEAGRKAYVPGRTTRAFTPGPMSPGTWAVELGAGWIPAGGVNFKVGIVQSGDAGLWGNDPFQPDIYRPYVANPKAGWYQGDTHVHGEQEPGNATMKDSLDLAFGKIVPGNPKAGAGLDFVDLVDHNNANNRLLLGSPEYRYPGKLVIPGTEITTYRGHMNSQNANRLVDFRTTAILRYDEPSPAPAPGDTVTLDQGDLTLVPGSSEPSNLFPEIDRLGGWGQLNHPTTWLTQPDLCRGCAWTYTDGETGWGGVDAMEIANGIADLNHGNPPLSLNPFTGAAIDLYEQRLAAGDHIAATGSSDDHRAGAGYGTGTDPIIGQGTTVTYARELSPAGIREAIRAGQTYVKVFGADAPDVYLKARTPEGYRGIEGHSLRGKSLELSLKVTGAADNTRPGNWFLSVLRNGAPVRTSPVTGNSDTINHSTAQSGRYSFRLYRQQGLARVTEAYSTPLWYTKGRVASPAPKFRSVKLNRKKGTARIRVKTIGAGRVVLKPGAVKKAVARSTDARKVVTLKVAPKRKLRKKLERRGRVAVKVAVSFSSEWTDTRTASKRIVLRKKPEKHGRR